MHDESGDLVFPIVISHLWSSKICWLDVINNELPFSFRTFHSISNKSSKMEDATSVAGTTNPSEAHEFTPFFNWVHL
jgi:hypothetical protein